MYSTNLGSTFPKISWLKCMIQTLMKLQSQRSANMPNTCKYKISKVVYGDNITCAQLTTVKLDLPIPLWQLFFLESL